MNERARYNHDQENPTEKAIAQGKQSRNWETYQFISGEALGILENETLSHDLTQQGYPFNEGFPNNIRANLGEPYEIILKFGDRAIAKVSYDAQSRHENKKWLIIEETNEKHSFGETVDEASVCAWKEFNPPEEKGK